MNTTETAPNRLINETSPYLLQHANNPVDWFPWCEEAFEKARREDKPIFLSIGYSTCHWCHVMAHESFEDSEVANILNDNFISIKVDKEERPDIDSIYMSVCQAFTRSGGWPTSIFMTAEQKPFFAGTYFPKQSRRGMIGFVDLLLNISEQWNSNNSKLINSGDEVIRILRSQTNSTNTSSEVTEDLVEEAINQFKDSFDKMYGGFGSAPKFPTPHNLLFLLNYYELNNDKEVLQIVEKTLLQMYKGGIFDHIGFGFSRYSTDRYWLVPHFEKMLYDNALLTMAYLKSYEITKNDLYKNIAVKTMEYVLRELTHDDGGFFSAQDADSDGVEGKYYVFTSEEIIDVLGRTDGKNFNECYNITQNGNFEGQNIPNLIKNNKFESSIEKLLPTIYEYRKTRYQLHKDDKILTSWNSLMIAAFANAHKILGDIKYLEIAEKAFNFIDNNLSDGNKLFTSYRNGKRTNNGFLDDYSFYIFSLIQMYEATFDKKHLTRAVELNKKVLSSFYDSENGGFYLYGDDSEQLVLKPKETYDGAIPSGNSVMAYNLVKLALYTKSADLESKAQKQLEYMAAHSTDYPAGHSFYMLTALISLYPPKEVICVLKDKSNYRSIVNQLPKNAIITIFEGATDEYPLKNNKTTFYICEHGKCLPPTNEL